MLYTLDILDKYHIAIFYMLENRTNFVILSGKCQEFNDSIEKYILVLIFFDKFVIKKCFTLKTEGYIWVVHSHYDFHDF